MSGWSNWGCGVTDPMEFGASSKIVILNSLPQFPPNVSWIAESKSINNVRLKSRTKGTLLLREVETMSCGPSGKHNVR